ncbi:uncharacterized protein Z519_00107 [Cladophialophora bantiana CBS 173.52]|uniref:PNPLA domain-containing protein n=1 Tax=Cladophialophora bantiana (strain ATCC 10958 / CBS 173.52 / CDC B-1940 / NIH 8579) TaxID=1442370 RepID=A0A0D2F8Q4_CLAB1|nr:uncharacterized protein Z519_00107 [Cladophialophora bantiana CBS 173.52]KIW98446.1 hypothetical protein Z519_00107 [Cladophialophora bantiana CBS 173.52]
MTDREPRLWIISTEVYSLACGFWAKTSQTSSAIRPTSAATTFFKPIECGRDRVEFIDSGFGHIGHNNPCDHLLHEARKVFLEAEIGCSVSIGTGLTGAIGVEGLTSPTDILKALKEMANQMEAVHTRLAQGYARNPYWRFNEDVTVGELNMDDDKKIKKIAAHTGVSLNHQVSSSK